MKICLKKLVNFLINSNGLFLVLSNFLLAIIGIRNKEWGFSFFHFYYEPIETKILAIINLPAIMSAQFVYGLFFTRSYSGSSITVYDFEMVLIVFFSILQWLLIGSTINFPFQKTQEKIK